MYLEATGFEFQRGGDILVHYDNAADTYSCLRWSICDDFIHSKINS